MMTRPSPQSLRRTAATAALLAALAVVADAHRTAAAPPTPTITERAFVDRLLPIPDVVMTTVGELLPEQSNAGASFLSGKYDPNIYLKEKATVAVTFVWEGAGYRNSFGVYKVDAQGKIYDVQIIWANASLPGSGGDLAAGTTAKIATKAGDKLGFFVIADGYTGNNFARFTGGHYEYRNADGSQASVGSADPQLLITFVARCAEAFALTGRWGFQCAGIASNRR